MWATEKKNEGYWDFQKPPALPRTPSLEPSTKGIQELEMNAAACQLTTVQLTFLVKSLARDDCMSFNNKPFLFGGYFSYVLRNNTYKKNKEP